jgi:methylenetetrahydrofolate reductase (NADPH)
MATAPQSAGNHRATSARGELLDGFSLEATMPTRAEVDALRDLVPAGTLVYLSAPPNQPAERQIAAARDVAAAGFVAVPHVVARAFASQARLDDFMARMAGEAGVTTVLAIAGDLAQPAGPFADALALIRSDVLQRHGVTGIGIAAYPDGHPQIADGALNAALNEKLDEAFIRGLGVHIVTQFCFDPEQILAWLRRIRYARVDVPVRIGVAGPTSMRGLLRYALRCGVRASLKGLVNPKASQLIGEVAPDRIIDTLADAVSLRNLEPLALHFFSFGGLVHTARWAIAAGGQRASVSAG